MKRRRRDRQTDRERESESTDDLSVWEYEINFGLPPPRVVRFHSVYPGVANLTEEATSKRCVSSRKHSLPRTEHLVKVTLWIIYLCICSLHIVLAVSAGAGAPHYARIVPSVHKGCRSAVAVIAVYVYSKCKALYRSDREAVRVI